MEPERLSAQGNEALLWKLVSLKQHYCDLLCHFEL